MGIDLESVRYIAEGAGFTFSFTVISFILGVALGSLLALMKLSSYKALSFITQLYVSIFRGTPVLVQLSIIYYAVPHFAKTKGYNVDITAFEAGIITFSLNSAAYISEIIRAGINAVHKGQFEAAKALNIKYRYAMQKIILPQALRNSLPALVNEFVNLLKETAIVSFIGISDIMKRAQVVSAEKYMYMGPLLVAALCYYMMVLIFSSFAKYLEHKVKL